MTFINNGGDTGFGVQGRSYLFKSILSYDVSFPFSESSYWDGICWHAKDLIWNREVRMDASNSLVVDAHLKHDSQCMKHLLSFNRMPKTSSKMFFYYIPQCIFIQTEKNVFNKSTHEPTHDTTCFQHGI
jgi:hypothetical protein